MANRKSIPSAIKLRLFSEAAGFCQRPECLDPLFPPEMGGAKHIAEMAHVIPHGESGPRYEDRPEEDFDPDTFDNLILLCPTCHTMVDKDPEAFPRDLLLTWKQEHLARLALKQGVKTYECREEARHAVSARMAENKAIWEKYAPVDGSAFEYDPEADAAQLWQQRMRSTILPNHYRLLSIVEANLPHATGDEQKVFAEYKEHVRGLAQRHICGEAGSAIRFPQEMESIFA